MKLSKAEMRIMRQHGISPHTDQPDAEMFHEAMKLAKSEIAAKLVKTIKANHDFATIHEEHKHQIEFLSGSLAATQKRLTEEIRKQARKPQPKSPAGHKTRVHKANGCLQVWEL